MTIAIIPSRFGSKRFYGKPLALISGKPMIQRVYEQAAAAETITKVIVATDDQHIFEAVEAFGGEAVMTASHHRSGTDRVAEASNRLNLDPEEIVINVQGDQPVFSPLCLDHLTAPFEQYPETVMSTLAVAMDRDEKIKDPGNVKVVFDKNGDALYFSRSPIPFPRDNDTKALCYKHLGFYAYKKRFLDTIAALPDSSLENTEKLEQLRVLEYGYKIRVVLTEHNSPSVDKPEDINPIEKRLSR